MDTDALNFSVLWPFVFVAVGAMAVLLAEVLPLSGVPGTSGTSGRSGREERARPGSRQSPGGLRLFAISTVFLVLALGSALLLFTSGVDAPFNALRPMIWIDSFSSMAIAIVAVGTLLSVWLSPTYLHALRIDHGEYYALILLAAAGMFVMVSAVDLMAVYLGLELMSIPIYALAGFDRNRLRSNESALKYFLTGAFASGILLYGVALLYGATGHIDFAGIRTAFDSSNPLAMAGLALLFVGFAFKVGAVPFHQWLPDVYEGAPTSVTAFMSVTVKATAFLALMRFTMLALPASEDRLEGLFWVLAVLTMIVGSVMAVIQENVKRLLAYSSIAHAGFLLIGFATATPEARSAVTFYLAIYTFINLGALGGVLSLAMDGRECERIQDFAGLARRRPVLAALMTLFLLALAGIPGTGGFLAKFYLLSAAVSGGEIVLAIVAVVTSAISVYYYLRLPVAMYMLEDESRELPAGSPSQLITLALCAGVVLYTGFLPDLSPFAEAVRGLEAGLPGVASGAD